MGRVWVNRIRYRFRPDWVDYVKEKISQYDSITIANTEAREKETSKLQADARWHTMARQSMIIIKNSNDSPRKAETNPPAVSARKSNDTDTLVANASKDTKGKQEADDTSPTVTETKPNMEPVSFNSNSSSAQNIESARHTENWKNSFNLYLKII